MPRWLIHLIANHQVAIGVLAILIGVIGGVAAVAFDYLIALWSYVMTGYADYSAHAGSGHGFFTEGFLGKVFSGRWFLLLVPVISALMFSPLVSKFSPGARGLGIPEVMHAVRREGGVIRGRVFFGKMFSAALSIGGGGSVGRVGPIVQIGAAAGSWISTKVGLPSKTVILMAGCGSAAGVAAAFNAPLAGAVFALELILVTFNAQAFTMVVLSSVSAAVVSHFLWGDNVIFQIPADLVLGDHFDLIFVALVGIIACLVAVGFSKLMYLVEDLFSALYRGPEWARPVVGGFLVGALLLIWPELYGSSYPVQLDILEHGFTTSFILFLLLGRVLATCVTVGAGFSGGIFAPTLFMGACVGAACGQIFAPWCNTSSATLGVIGMGAAFAGAARAPITSVLIVVEMTQQYELILPIMLAVVLATALSRFLTRKTVYTEKLIRRGEQLDDPLEKTLIGHKNAKQIMSKPPAVLPDTATIEEAGKVLYRTESPALPVVTEGAGKFLGCVTPLMLAKAQSYGAPTSALIRDLELDTTTVAPLTESPQVLQSLMSSSASALPVVEGQSVVGWIAGKDVVDQVYRQQARAQKEAQSQSSWGVRMQRRIRAAKERRQEKES